MTVSLLHIYHTSSSVLWLQAGGERLMIDNKNYDVDESYDGDDLIGSIIFMIGNVSAMQASSGELGKRKCRFPRFSKHRKRFPQTFAAVKTLENISEE